MPPNIKRIFKTNNIPKFTKLLRRENYDTMAAGFAYNTVYRCMYSYLLSSKEEENIKGNANI